jgi:glucose/arabinose dehydrogenase
LYKRAGLEKSPPGPGQTHLGPGIQYHEGFLYISNASHIFRWAFTPGARVPLNSSSAQVVINGIDSSGDHVTRTMLFDRFGALYVNIGAFDDVDEDSTRARIRVFKDLSNLPISFDNGEVHRC